MIESKKSMLFSALNVCYGTNAETIRARIRTEHETSANHERTFLQAATAIAPRCSSFTQAQDVVKEWAGI
jgi:hypothetical protein